MKNEHKVLIIIIILIIALIAFSVHAVEMTAQVEESEMRKCLRSCGYKF